MRVIVEVCTLRDYNCQHINNLKNILQVTKRLTDWLVFNTNLSNISVISLRLTRRQSLNDLHYY
jgi:hypothetical protein